MKIAMVTPTGNIGAPLVQKLLEAKAELTVLARSPERLPESVRAQATVHQGVLEDKQFVRQATQGADVLFWLTPYNLSEPDQDARYQKLMASVSGAVTTNKIPYVVHLSSFGAQRREEAGFVSYVGKMEECLNTTEASVLHLRAGFFMENYLMVLPWIKSDSVVTLPLPATTVLPLVATRDIAEVAAKKLLQCDWQGQVVQAVHGPDDLSQSDAATVLGESIGKPLQYQETPMEMFREVLKNMGASEEGIRCDVELMQAFAQPGIVAEPRTLETTTTTTLQEWGRNVLKPLANSNLELN